MPIETLTGSSTMISSAEWDSDRNELRVTLSKGREYVTPDFKKEDWQAFQDAPSKGGWYRQNVMRLVR